MTSQAQLLSEDAANRERALALESFIVEAPAGAGKTELLTQRYLRLLATVDAPEEIVAITFTNKAAGEMRARIQDSLALAREAEPELPHKRITWALARAALERSAALNWQIEAQAGRLRLTTIDALCASLARQMPFLSRFGSQPALTESAQVHYAEAARRALGHLEDDDAYAEAVATALGYFDNDMGRLATLLAKMLERREQWQGLTALDDPETALHEAVAALVSEELRRVAAICDAHWQERFKPHARFAASNLGGGELMDWQTALTADDSAGWRALADLLLTQEGTVRKRVDKRNGFPADKEFKAQKDAFLAALGELGATQVGALARVRDLPQLAPQADHAEEAVVRALVTLMKLAAAELWLIFRERGEIDFGELAARAIVALGDELDPSELGLRLDYRVRHLLVDEFQDTSPMQVQLLERLTAGWQPGDGRTLFAVGDPMQSIYRFRKADVGLFLHVAATGIGNVRLTPLRLYRNNRSCGEVVEWINTRFPALFPASDDPVRGEIAYREFAATRDALPQAGVRFHPVLVHQDAEDAASREAQQVIALIETEWRTDPTRTIAVLVRARSHLAELVAAIKRHSAGWRYSAVEIEPLLERQVIQDLISLTRALHHRADRVHWLAVLRAPWCGLTLADLHGLAGDDHDATIWSLMCDETRVSRLSADGQTRLRHARGVLAEALAGQGRQSRRRWLEDAWRKLGGPLCLVESSDHEDVQAFFSRLDALDAAGRFDFDNLDEDMNRLFAAPDSEADGRLQLMTIHKAKGLEFDTVILPGLHREVRGGDLPLLAWDSFALDSGEQLIAAPINRRNAAKEGQDAGPTVYDFLQRMERERSRNEDVRVLYVAATRAVRALHWVGVVTCDESGQAKAPAASSALGCLWSALASEVVNSGAEAVPATAVVTAQHAAQFTPQLVRVETNLLPRLLPRPAVTVAANDEPAEELLAAAIGTLTHACLEQIALMPQEWSASVVESRRPAFERWLYSRGWSEADARRGAIRVAYMLTVSLASKDGRWVLRQRDSAVAETALSRMSEDVRVETRVVDRSFVEDGVRWIIDYKTAWLGEAADRTLLCAHAVRYRAQLEGYAKLFTSDGLPRQIAVFYVAHGILARLDYNPAT